MLKNPIRSWLVSFMVWGGPWFGKIVDYDTGEPLENAVVVAIWERTVPGIGDSVEYFHKAKEAVTDADGNFRINSFFPINLFPLITSINRPYFVVFKPGYLNIKSTSGQFLAPSSKNEIIEFSGYSTLGSYTGRFGANRIELPKLKNINDRKRVLLSIPPLVPDKTIPNFIKYMNEEEVSLGLKPTHNFGDEQ